MLSGEGVPFDETHSSRLGCKMSEAHKHDLVFDLIISLLRDADNEHSPLSAAVHLYNEGWLLRVTLALHFRGISCLPFTPAANAKWYSEPLLYSHFHARMRGDDRAESHTHADAVVGHITINKDTRRGLALSSDASQFIVVEAKLASLLQSRTRNAKGWDQAVRNVACMAETISRSDPPRSCDEFDQLGFYVISPEDMIPKHQALVCDASMSKKIHKRIQQSEGPQREELDMWRVKWFEPLIRKATIKCISWEEVILRCKQSSPEDGRALDQFYEKCRSVARSTR